jgi:hypothetical protein
MPEIDSYQTENGLPPVAPPSGKFIIQLFLVPALIVAVAVFLWVGARWLANEGSAPDKLLNGLADANPEVRWRAADDLAQRLTRDDQLAANPTVALRLSELVRAAIDDIERAAPSASDPKRQDERKALLQKRKDIEFLCPCLGALIVPTGVPLLNELAQLNKGADAKSLVLLRRRAVWSLANLGENLKRFDQLPADKKEAILSEFQEIARAGGQKSHWAQLSADYLQETKKNIGVIQALAECAKADDPYLRTLVGFALTFWEGDPSEKEQAEKTLLTLSRDDGHGVRIEIGEAD